MFALMCSLSRIPSCLAGRPWHFISPALAAIPILLGLPELFPRSEGSETVNFEGIADYLLRCQLFA